MIWIMTFIYILVAISFAWLLFKGVCKNNVLHSIIFGVFWLFLIPLIPVSLICKGIYAVIKYFGKFTIIRQ